ncbi:TolB family protein [Candidatus Neomarinimicrobiota bacterium]
MDLNGSNRKQLTNITGFISDFHISPNYGQIVFASNNGGMEQIFVMDNNGNNIKNITNTHYHCQCPSFSSDGSQIAFSGYYEGN